jgi:L-cysteine:1D-myo-inositol 2-amino-2-deoxy-alpha-D-glucopyranoside ligase
MPNAVARLEMWRAGVGGYPSDVLDQVRDALDDDLDTPRAFAAMDDEAGRGHDVTVAAELLGILL